MNVLQILKNDGVINDYIVYINKNKRKTGIPCHQDAFDEIYLYSNNEYVKLDEKISLKPRIKAISKNIPWLLIYVVPSNQNTNFNKLSETILDRLAIRIAGEIKLRLEELFPSFLISGK